MRIEFTKEEIEEIILEAARQYDPRLNTVFFKSSYYSVDSATVSYEPPKEKLDDEHIKEIAETPIQRIEHD